MSDDNNKISILISSLHKSGGTYVFKTLEEGLGLRHVHIGNGYFPYEMIQFEKIIEFSKGGCIDNKHIDASKANLWFLKHYGVRSVVHVRDPRQSLLSWIHYIINNIPEGEDHMETPGYTVASPPREWYALPFAEKVDYFIENNLAYLVEWINGWLAARESADLPVLFTDYGALLRDEAGFFRRILEFCGYDPAQFPSSRPDKDERVNFRRGNPHEWREALSEDQQGRVTEAIPAVLFDVFGWER